MEAINKKLGFLLNRKILWILLNSKTIDRRIKYYRRLLLLQSSLLQAEQ